MESVSNKQDLTVAALVHASTFSKYFIPLGNFIFPLILWTAKKQDPFVDEHGKQALNFQISIFLYFIALVILGIAGLILIGFSLEIREPFYFTEDFVRIGNPMEVMPALIYGAIIGVLTLGLFFLNIIAVITATVRASEGKMYKYPLTISFITPAPTGKNQSQNEQFNNTQNPTL